MLRTYSTCSYPGYQDTTTYAALDVMMVLIMLMINFLLVTYYSEKCTDHILGGWEPPAARG